MRCKFKGRNGLCRHKKHNPILKGGTVRMSCIEKGCPYYQEVKDEYN